MTFRPTTLERAFELARSGKYSNTTDVRKQLRLEGFDLHQLEGRALLSQLRALCQGADRP